MTSTTHFLGIITCRFRTHAWPCWWEWPYIVLQMLIVSSMEIADDLFRGNILAPEAHLALEHGRQIADFEAVHGLFVEASIQHYFQHTHHLLGVPITTWPDIVAFTNSMYAVFHLFVFGVVLAWVYIDHRPHFTAVRNIALLTDALAVLGYEVYPAAPPRLTTGLVIHHHCVRFQDTMQGLIGGGRLHGTAIGYNEFSAMPSVHVAWALIVAGCIILLARRPLPRILGALYPVAMIFAVVVSGNHYVLDAVGAVVVLGLATVLALGLQRAWTSLQSPLNRQKRHLRTRPGYPL